MLKPFPISKQIVSTKEFRDLEYLLNERSSLVDLARAIRDNIVSINEEIELLDQDLANKAETGMIG